METSLHRELKSLYADDRGRTEVRLGDFRIDALDGDRLVEIQHGSLAAIRDKIARLVKKHRVLVVKPVVASKLLVKRKKKNGTVAARRRSPKRGTTLDAFDELIYFTRVFPHKNLSVEVLMVDVEEWRYPGHGRRRRWRRKDHVVEDQKLIAVQHACRISASRDLWRLLPEVNLPSPFHTGHLAAQIGVQRWIAQRIAYVLRNCGAVRQVGKQRNTLLYDRDDGVGEDRVESVPRAARRRRKAA